MKKISFALLLCSSLIAGAQSPQLTIVQAANQPATTTPAVPAAQATTAASASDSATVVKLLQEMKTTNDETLKKQQATLERLDELEKAAEQIKIFAHRG
jgi:hypothetical protein